jgi:hypothetical protein
MDLTSANNGDGSLRRMVCTIQIVRPSESLLDSNRDRSDWSVDKINPFCLAVGTITCDPQKKTSVQYIMQNPVALGQVSRLPRSRNPGNWQKQAKTDGNKESQMLSYWWVMAVHVVRNITQPQPQAGRNESNCSKLDYAKWFRTNAWDTGYVWHFEQIKEAFDMGRQA